MDWGMVGAIGGLLADQTGLLLWMMSKLDSDIKGIATEAKADSRALNARVDMTQGIIMRMLENQGK